jgi:hypothetical protein
MVTWEAETCWWSQYNKNTPIKLKYKCWSLIHFMHPSTVFGVRVSSSTSSLTFDIRKIQLRSSVLIERSEFSGTVPSINNSSFWKLHLPSWGWFNGYSINHQCVWDCLCSSGIILIWIAWTEFGWLWISRGACLLLTRLWTFGFRKRRSISWAADLLVISEKVHACTRVEWVAVGNLSARMETSAFPPKFDNKFHEGCHVIKSRSPLWGTDLGTIWPVALQHYFVIWWNTEV